MSSCCPLPLRCDSQQKFREKTGETSHAPAPASVRRVENTRFPILFSWIVRSAARRLRTCVPLPRLRAVFPGLRALAKTGSVALASGRASTLRGSFVSKGKQPAQGEREQHHHDTQRRHSGSQQNWDYSQHCASPCFTSAISPLATPPCTSNDVRGIRRHGAAAAGVQFGATGMSASLYTSIRRLTRSSRTTACAVSPPKP